MRRLATTKHGSRLALRSDKVGSDYTSQASFPASRAAGRGVLAGVAAKLPPSAMSDQRRD
jgi:hypothetical protein